MVITKRFSKGSFSLIIYKFIMKVFLKILFLFLLSSNAKSEWIKISETTDYDAYTNLKNIHQENNIANIWILLDFKKIQTLPTNKNKRFLSLKINRQSNCIDKMSMTLFHSWHSKNMGKGSVVESAAVPENFRNWEFIQPDSMNEKIIMITCSQIPNDILKEKLKKLFKK
tara:strand:- start:621 stop:1130 length:510 start_codon:yes stop_codon:yes gene_type:complete